MQEDIYYKSALPTIMIFVEELGPVMTLTLFEMDRADLSLVLATKTCNHLALTVNYTWHIRTKEPKSKQ